MAEPPAMAPMAGCSPGQVLDGRYLIVRQIAAGGMSSVFEATHVKIGRTVAIKILHPALASDPDLVARFLKEARVVGTIGHPNIVASTDFGELPGHIPYLVLEYLDGRTLGHEIKTGGPLAVPRALRIASLIASALDAAHARGVVHRDLTAENVFLARIGADPDHVKVLDFGISKFLALTPPGAGERVDAGTGARVGTPVDVDPSPTTRRGLTMGTPEFMAPEQISDPSAVDARVDVYALGVILHYMLAGQTPFGTPFGRLPAHVLLARILVAPIPAIERSDVPDDVRALVAKALAKDADERFSNMREMQEAIARSLAAIAGPPSSGRARRPPRWIAYGAVGLVAVVAAAVFLRAQGPPPAPGSSAAPPVAGGAGSGADRRPGAVPARAVDGAPVSGQETQPSAAATDGRRSAPEAMSPREPSPESSERARAAPAQRRAAARRSKAVNSAPPAPEVAKAPPPADDSAAVSPARDQPVARSASEKPARPAPAGAVDPALVQALVRSRLSEIERCYDRGKMDDPELKGRVTVRIHLDPRGAVTADEIESSSLANSGVESCILDAVRSWKFPAPAGEKTAVISYPFNLR